MAPVELTHLLTNFLFFIIRVKVWNFTGIKKVVDVLQEGLVFDLHTPFVTDST